MGVRRRHQGRSDLASAKFNCIYVNSIQNQLGIFTCLLLEFFTSSRMISVAKRYCEGARMRYWNSSAPYHKPALPITAKLARMVRFCALSPTSAKTPPERSVL